MNQQTQVPEELVPLLAELEIWDFDRVCNPGDRLQADWDEKLVPYPNGKADRVFYWRCQRSAFDSPQELARKRGLEVASAMHLLGLLSARVGIRLSAEHNWRPLAANPVWHELFGPSVAVATDGVRVVLLREARVNADFFLAHITNCIGYVTSTPVPLGAHGSKRGAKAPSAKSKLLARLADQD